MAKHGLVRHAFLFFLIATCLALQPKAFAIGEDQIEKDLQQEELNINSEQSVITDTTISPTENFSNQQLTASTEGLVLDERDLSEMPAGQVELEHSKESSLPYKQRRSRDGVLFSLGMERLDPVEYISLLDDVPIKDMLGDSTVNLIGAELGYKYNFPLGSLYIIGGFASGKLSSETSGTARELDIQKLSLSTGYAADAIFNEPWIVPYGQAGIHQFSVSESSNEISDSATTQLSLNYRFGLLFQLDWIEKSIDSNTHEQGLRSSGLENTFIDLFFSWYQPSPDLFDPENPVGTASGDPDLSSEATFGVALKMEF